MSQSTSIIKTGEEIEQMKEGAEVSMKIMRQLIDKIDIGVSTLEIDNLAEELCLELNAVPAFKGVVQTAGPFQNAVCISVNDEILHAIPRSDVKFEDGDVIKVDFGIEYKGYFTDHCVTIGLGNVSEQDQRLIKIGKMAVEAGVNQAKAGNTTGDIGFAMQSVAEMAGFNVIKDFVGHGIGKTLHQEPTIYAYGVAGEGEALEVGMVICVEAQVVAGSDAIFVDSDGWTVKTEDRKKGVMFEYMVAVTEHGPEVLTDNRDWPVTKSLV